MPNNWLRKWDLLHTPISLSYNNEYFYTTTVGAILTIICFLVVLSISIYQIKSLVDKSSFSIITNQYTDLSESIDFDERPFLFQLIDNAGRIMEADSKLYEFKAVNMEWLVKFDENGKQYSEVISTQLNMDRCDKVLHNSEYLKTLDLSKFSCINSGQNITSYGYFGDMDNGFKGFRIYLNKCNNNNCYDESVILSKLSNIKFRVSYLGLNTNIFKIGTSDLNYQMTSKACSVSTNILKKVYFSFSFGRFFLFNDIFTKKKKEYNYIIGNSPTIDVDLDPSSTSAKNRDTLAYFSFNYDGNIVEIKKEVKRFYDTLSFIGNTFNIALTIIKIVNNFYSNKVLFVDVFQAFFLFKDDKKEKTFQHEKFKIFKNFNNDKNIDNKSKKYPLDISDGIELNNVSIVNNNNLLKKSQSNNPNNKKLTTLDKNNPIRNISIMPVNNEERKVKNKFIYYYVLPLCILRKHKIFSSLYIIKDKICTYFSIEKFYELSKLKEALDQKVKKIAINKTELLKINKKYDSYDSMDYHDKNKKS